jgi:ABC-type glycerol-3-phosphate transport system substrate-binding protein
MRFERALLFVLLLAAAGCTVGLPAASPTAGASLDITPTLPLPAPTVTPTPTPSGPQRLILWLPPQFSPGAETPGGERLQAQLDAFQAARPEINLEVWRKAEEGPANVLDFLQKTAAAAPANLPDLVVLRRADLEAAAAMGLLHPIEGLTLAFDDPDWFPVGRDLVSVQGTFDGLPLAFDVLVIVWRTSAFESPPQTGQDFTSSPLLFPAQDSHAWLPFAVYRGLGGLLQTEGQIGFQPEPLMNTLALFADGAETGWVHPASLEQTGYDAAWETFQSGGVEAAIVWLSDYLAAQPEGVRMMPLPLSDDGATLADGWVLALAGSVPEKQALAMRLVESLTTPEFLAEWSQAVGYLPARPRAATSWDGALLPPGEAVHLGTVALRAPSQAEQDALGLRLQQAVVRILQGEPQETVLDALLP